MKTSSVGASPSRGNGGTVRRQLLKKLKQSPDGGETLDRRQLLAALAELKRGSFDVRLPDGWIGLDGKIADAFNDVVALNQRMSRELERLRRVVGQEGRIAERTREPATKRFAARLAQLDDEARRTRASQV